MSLIKFIKSKEFLKQIAIAVAVVLLSVFIVFKWLTLTTNHDQKIEVPDLKKMSLSEVASALEELDLKWLVIDSASYNPSYPKKSVIDQDPDSGGFVKECVIPVSYGDNWGMKRSVQAGGRLARWTLREACGDAVQRLVD